MKRWAAIAGAVAALAGCTDIVGLGTLISDAGGSARTFSGSVSGAAATDTHLKVVAIPGVGSNPTSGRGQVVSVVGGGFSVRVDPGEDRNYTVFAFSDANENGRFDAGEGSSFGATGRNSYYQLAWDGETWRVTEVRASGPSTKTAASTRLDIVFNG